MSKICVTRLRKEFAILLRDPIPNIQTLPNPNDICEWFYVVTGPKDSPYAGGAYLGKVKFPSEYPCKPPSISMITPSGRFKPDARLCLSMSDYHPETWNPMWNVGSILVGLLSFMLSNEMTTGSIQTTTAEKRRLASLSMQFNRSHPMFCKLFPEFLEREGDGDDDEDEDEDDDDDDDDDEEEEEEEEEEEGESDEGDHLGEKQQKRDDAPENLAALSIRDLKTRLDALGISYEDCVEKSQLVTRLAKKK